MTSGLQDQGLQLATCVLNVARIGVDSVAYPHVFVVIEVVESPHLEGAVVGTVTSSNATVVGHCIDPFVGVNRCRHRANLFARCRFAVHAGDRLLNDVGVIELRILLVPLEVAIDPQPVHFAAVEDLLATDNGDVVFALTGDHTSVAANALGQIDCHAPLGNAIVFCLVLCLDHLHRFLPERAMRPDVGNVRALGFGKLRGLLEQLHGAFSDQGEAAVFGLVTTSLVDRPVILRGGKFVLVEPRAGFDAVSNQQSRLPSEWKRHRYRRSQRLLLRCRPPFRHVCDHIHR